MSHHNPEPYCRAFQRCCGRDHDDKSCDVQGDLTRRFARRALQLAALCALLVTLSTFLLKIFGANEQRIRSAQAANLLPVKRPWSAGPSLTGTGGASEASPASHLPLLTHALHARTWPTAGVVPCFCPRPVPTLA